MSGYDQNQAVFLPGSRRDRAFVLIAGAGDISLYERLAAFLSAQGFSVLIVGLRGFAFDKESLGSVERASWLGDTRSVIATYLPDIPLSVVGHSLGAAVASKLVQDGLSGAQELVLFNPVFKMKHRIELVGRSSRLQLALARLLYRGGVSSEKVKSKRKGQSYWFAKAVAEYLLQLSFITYFYEWGARLPEGNAETKVVPEDELLCKHWPAAAVMEALMLRRDVFEGEIPARVTVKIADGAEDVYCASGKWEVKRFRAFYTTIEADHFLPMYATRRAFRLMMKGLRPGQ